MSKNHNISVDRARNILAAGERYVSGMTHVLGGRPQPYAAGSIIDAELSSVADVKLVSAAYDAGWLSIDSAADHLMALLRTFKEPAMAWAPWTCARGLLESASLAVWLLDPIIGPEERTMRSLSFRYHGLCEQLKMASDQVKKDRINARIESLELRAVASGLTQIRDRNGKRNGLGQPWPGITSLTEIALGAESQYRRLSAIAHGHHWAIPQVGLRQIAGTGSLQLEKVVKPESVFWTVAYSLRNMSRAVWNGFSLVGGDMLTLEGFFEESFDSAGLGDNLRFWRP